MNHSTFRLQVKLPRSVVVVSYLEPKVEQTLERDEFYGWCWGFLEAEGVLGIHEGTLLSSEAAEQGFETDGWTVDAGEAPRERDWISSQDLITAEFYFPSLDSAKSASEKLRLVQGLEIGRIEEQKSEDWDAQWKASFLSSPTGVQVSPNWRILPPWVSKDELQQQEGGDCIRSDEVLLRINPGAGFGTGTHETTQLCLEAIGQYSRQYSIRDEKVLDFGSGSGILAIGAALLGAQVEGVEIDPLAIDNAIENAALNGVESQISFSQSLGHSEIRYRMVIANILRPVLLQFAEQLVSRMDSKGILILSGLIEKDVEEVARTFGGLLGFNPEHRSLGEWQALIWKKGPA